MALMDINDTRGILCLFRDLGFELEIHDMRPKEPKPDGYLNIGNAQLGYQKDA